MTFHFDKALKAASRPLLRECTYNHEEPEKMAGRMFQDLVSKVLGVQQKGGTPPQAEETTLELIRQGLPKSDIKFRFSHLAISLKHSTFYLYRGEPATRVVQVNWNGYRGTVKSTLSPKELARAILDFDAKCPELEVRMTEFLRRIAVERKAEEIQRITVKTQLDAVIPAMGLGCSFEVKDGKVHLDLSRTFQGSVDLPLAELQAFLSDPERILDTLQPDKEGHVDDRGHYFPGRWSTVRIQ